MPGNPWEPEPEWAMRRHGHVHSHMVRKQESGDQSPGGQALGCVLPRAAPGSTHGAADSPGGKLPPGQTAHF